MVKSIRFAKNSLVQLSDIEEYAKKQGIKFNTAVFELFAKALGKITTNGSSDSLNTRLQSLESELDRLIDFKKRIEKLVNSQGVEL